MQRAGAGCRAITISVPCRWVHTTTECVHPDDMKSAVALIKAYCER
jgi:putative aminopeptidase FrvX